MRQGWPRIHCVDQDGLEFKYKFDWLFLLSAGVKGMYYRFLAAFLKVSVN